MTSYSKLSLAAVALAAIATVASAATGAEGDSTASLNAKIPVAQAVTAGDPHANGKPFNGQKLAKNAKVAMADARAIALKAHPGTITDEELEKETGGTGLRYSFDIKGAEGTQEVGVDAMTGRVLENKLEGPNPD
jgi:uncharacterized membrane protein YkoI